MFIRFLGIRLSNDTGACYNGRMMEISRLSMAAHSFFPSTGAFAYWKFRDRAMYTIHCFCIHFFTYTYVRGCVILDVYTRLVVGYRSLFSLHSIDAVELLWRVFTFLSRGWLLGYRRTLRGCKAHVVERVIEFSIATGCMYSTLTSYWAVIACCMFIWSSFCLYV